MIKRLWHKFEDIAHWVVLACFVLVFMPFVKEGAILLLALVGGPAFFAMQMKESRERRQRIYDKGFNDGKDSVKNVNE